MSPADPTALLAQVKSGKVCRDYRRKQVVFAQGDPADAVFFVERGQVKLTVVSAADKTAVIGLLGPGTFFGEGCLAGQTVRMSTASAVPLSRIVRVVPEGDGRPAASRDGVRRDVHGLRPVPQRPHRGRPGGPALQLQREAAGPRAPAARPFRQGLEAGDRSFRGSARTRWRRWSAPRGRGSASS